MQSVESALAKRWFHLRRTKLLGRQHKRENGVLMASLALLNCMIFFVQRYLHFVFLEVIDPQWHIMLSRIHSAASLDEVLTIAG